MELTPKRMWSRRDLLVGFLGLPILPLACRPQEPVRFDGGFVGPNPAVGHRLRDGFLPAPADDMVSTHDVVIVGGGVAGLSAAWRLHHADRVDFVVVELESQAGGTARSGKNAVSAYPLGAHYIPVPPAENRSVLRLLDEMGVAEGRTESGAAKVREPYLIRMPEERLYIAGRYYDGLFPRAGASPADLEQYRRFYSEVETWVKKRDHRGRRALTLPLALASADAEVTSLDRQSMAEWMDQRGFLSKRLRWYVDYACRDDYGTRLDNTSAWAGLLYFAGRVSEPGEDSAEFISWPEGNGRIVQHLEQRVGKRVRTGILVTDVFETSDGRVRIHGWDVAAEKPIGFVAKQAIVATGVHIARHIVRRLRDPKAAWCAAFDYSPWLVVNLTLRDRPTERGFGPAWDSVFYQSPSLGYVSATHQGLKDHGSTVWTWYLAMVENDTRSERKRLLELDWRECADIALTDIRRAHPNVGQLVEFAEVVRWGHAMIRPTPGFVFGGARQEAAMPLGPICLANTDLSGVALFEEAHDQGVRVAERALVELGHDVETFR